jgi:hypothetical protein
MHKKRRNKIVLAFLLAYVLAYGLLRTTHSVVHEGAYYENGVKKFHDHRMDTTICFLLPLFPAAVEVIFAPAMLLEKLFWHGVYPISPP